MKYSGLKMRGIAPLVVVCCLMGVGSQVARAQTPKSGALLSIDSSSGSGVTVHAKIYDSQIHSGVVQTVPTAGTCAAGDQLFPTDAYVLQGGSWTGCDALDPFEVTDGNTSSPHQAAGTVDFFGFHIETHYRIRSVVNISAASQSGGNTTYSYTLNPAPDPDLQVGESIVIAGMTGTGVVDNGTFVITAVNTMGVPKTFTVANAGGANASGQSGTGTVAVCNTSGTICANPDTGFLTITNNNSSSFTGTITLGGNSPIAGGPSCPAGGVASDSFTGTLVTTTGSVTLALAPDSSNCGGFNAAQTQTLVAGTTSIFPFGNDDYQITPFDSLPGDMLTVLPIPVPAGPLNISNMYGSETLTPLSSRFSATNFPGQDCIAYKDLSAAFNPVCLEFQVSCLNGAFTCSDALTYLYTSQIDFTKDPNSLTTIGGTALLGEHSGSPVGYSGQCPTSGFNLNVFFLYTPTAPDPITGRGTGSNCYVGTFDPTAAGVPVGQTLTQKTFVGFGKPVVNCTGIFPAPCGNIYFINQGKSLPLYWQTFSDSAGTVPVTNLNFCGNQSGTGCTTPWVFVGTSAVNCATDVPTAAIQAVATGASGFRYVGPPLGTFPAGTYTYNVDTGTVTTATGCFTPVLGFSTGFWSFDVAEIEFK